MLINLGYIGDIIMPLLKYNGAGGESNPEFKRT